MTVRTVARVALDAAVTVTTIAGVALVATRAVDFGSRAGLWTYAYVGWLDARLVILAVGTAVLAVVLYELARARADARPWVTVPAVFVGGVGVQLLLRGLSPYPMADVVVSDVANSFYGAAGRVGAGELLADFGRVSSRLPLHARHNMPGKLLLYQAMRAATLRPDVLAVMIVVLSSLVGLLLYLTCTRLFGRRDVGLDAMALWMVVPSKIGFFPLLNAVSPLPALAAVWCLARYLTAPNLLWAVLAGVLAYATALFDPLALWLGVAFAPLILHAAVAGELRWGQALLLVVTAALALAGTYLGMRAATGFDILHVLVGKTEVFSNQPYRPYEIWVVANLKDIALAAGPAVAVTFLAACLLAVWTLVRPPAAGVGPGAIVTLATLGVLLTLETIGFERGEVARLWIFLLAPVQVAVAWGVARSHAATRWLVLAGTIVFAAASAATVGYVVP